MQGKKSPLRRIRNQARMIAYGKKWSIIILKGIKKKETVVNSFNIKKKKITYFKQQNRNDGFSVWSSNLN